VTYQTFQSECGARPCTTGLDDPLAQRSLATNLLFGTAAVAAASAVIVYFTAERPPRRSPITGELHPARRAGAARQALRQRDAASANTKTSAAMASTQIEPRM